MAIEIRKGTEKDVDAFIHLLQEVRETMEHKEWFYLDPPEDVRKMMADGIMQLWVAMDGEKMAAGFDVLLPGLAEFNYGHDLGFTEEQLLRVVNMDSAAVHPHYRGQGLQKRLLQTAEAEIRMAGERILLCTVHPENRFSLQNVLSQGYTVQKTQAKYGSVRHILRKDI